MNEDIRAVLNASAICQCKMHTGYLY